MLTSQVISNVPAALLLSGFTTQWKPLIVGCNLGGLGTLIASMASLISYKMVAREISGTGQALSALVHTFQSDPAVYFVGSQLLAVNMSILSFSITSQNKILV